MFKINSYSSLLLTLLFFNSSNVLCFSSKQPSNSSLPSAMNASNRRFRQNPNPDFSLHPAHTNTFLYTYNARQQAINEDNKPLPRSFFPSIKLYPEHPASTCPLNSRSTTPQPTNFNKSTNTFMQPLSLLGSDPSNSSTNTFNINHLFPIAHQNYGFNNNTNRNPSLFIPSDPIPSDTTNNAIHTNKRPIRSVVHHTQEVAYTNQGKDCVLVAKTKLKKRTNTCPTCNKKVDSHNLLNFHVTRNDRKRPRLSQYHICHKSFTKKSILQKHIKRHNEEKPFKCNFCSKRFATNSEKVAHHLSHTKQRSYKCLFCYKFFYNPEDLQTHLSIHTEKQKRFKCNICPKGLSSPKALEYHLKKHVEENQCNIPKTQLRRECIIMKTPLKPKDKEESIQKM